MMITSKINRSRGLNDLLEGHVAQDVDKVREVEVVREPLKFNNNEILLDYVDSLNDCRTVLAFMREVKGVLTPEQINQFLQATTLFQDHVNYVDNTGVFVSKLIQNSCNAGYNDFVLNIPRMNKKLNHLGSNLSGYYSDNLRITVNGNLGDSCFKYIERCTLTINGDVGDDCIESMVSSEIVLNGNGGRSCGTYERVGVDLTVNGNVGEFFGSGFQGSSLVLNGDCSDNWGGSCESSVLTFNGKVGKRNHIKSRDCTFKTPILDNLKQFHYNETSKVYLIEDDGEGLIWDGAKQW